jgi:hypothetical protein
MTFYFKEKICCPQCKKDTDIHKIYLEKSIECIICAEETCNMTSGLCGHLICIECVNKIIKNNIPDSNSEYDSNSDSDISLILLNRVKPEDRERCHALTSYNDYNEWYSDSCLYIKYPTEGLCEICNMFSAQSWSTVSQKINGYWKTKWIKTCIYPKQICYYNEEPVSLTDNNKEIINFILKI